jgi:hypothetical protein
MIYEARPTELVGARFNLSIPFLGLVSGTIVLGTVALEAITRSQTLGTQLHPRDILSGNATDGGFIIKEEPNTGQDL